MAGIAGGRWTIGLATWIIQDGNYPDFKVGDERWFAIEFSLVPDAVADNRYGTYAVDAEVIFADQSTDVRGHERRAWAIDFGLRAYNSAVPPPNGLLTGGRLHSVIGLGVDPFDYFESLHSLQGMPPLIYQWRIEAIWKWDNDALEEANRRHAAGDLIRWPELPRRQVTATDAWGDDLHPANMGYLMECVLLDGEPRSMKPARHRPAP